MQRERFWKLLFVLVLITIVSVQIPVKAQVGFNTFIPLFTGAWTGYIPILHIDPTETPTPTPTATNTPVPTATFTFTPSPTATNTPVPPGTPPLYSTSYYLLTVD